MGGGKAVFLALLFAHLSAQPATIRIGGLFHPEDEKLEVAFRYAVDRVNAERILPRSRLLAQVANVSDLDSFHASKKVCQFLQNGVVAIFGPQSAAVATHVQSICDTMAIPHLETTWYYRPKQGYFMVNLYPHPDTLSRALVDLARTWEWKSFTIVYEYSDALVRLQELLKAYGPSVSVRQLPGSNDYGPLLKQIKDSAESHIVLDCATQTISKVLRQAQQIGIMSADYSYLITSLDFHSVDFDDFKYEGTNIIALRLLDPIRSDVKRVDRALVYDEARKRRKSQLVHTSKKDNRTLIETETALMYDAVQLFANALNDLNDTFIDTSTSQQIDVKLSCEAEHAWPHGYSLINHMKTVIQFYMVRPVMVEMHGLTGVIKLDHQGFRNDFTLDIIELTTDGLQKAGTWSFEEGVNYTRSYSEKQRQIIEILQNKTLVVTTILSAPYCMRQEASEMLAGNAQFEGYAIDLIHEISKILDFNYTFKLVPDGRHGSYNREHKQWDGMIRELLEQRADVAIADLTITYDREQVVDFTMPFMNLGISVLYRKQSLNLFLFLSPLSLGVWLCMAAVCLVVFALNLIITKAASRRMVAGMWSLFTMILVSLYTANLAAILTLERMNSPIESAEYLAEQTKIKYGALKGSSTAAFFRDSNISTYQHMWSFMESARPSVFTSSNEEGVERVMRGKGSYAYLMESPTIEYVVERNCDLTQVDGILDFKSYGIAMQRSVVLKPSICASLVGTSQSVCPVDGWWWNVPGCDGWWWNVPGCCCSGTMGQSPYRTAFSSAVLKLLDQGKLQALETKWWKEKRVGGSCTSLSLYELGLAEVGGVFLVLLGGLIVACVVAVFEFVWKRKVAVDEQDPLRLESLETLSVLSTRL